MEYKNGVYFLSEEETKRLREKIVHPDKSVMALRDAFFAEIDKSIRIEYQEDGGMIIREK